MVKVFHNPNFTKCAFLSEDKLVETVRDNEDKLELVAEVDTDNLDSAFNLTNHLEEDWSKNHEVTCIKKTRSTSVGDVVEMDGNRFAIGTVGFEPLF